MLVTIDKLYSQKNSCLCRPNLGYTCCKYNNIRKLMSYVRKCLFIAYVLINRDQYIFLRAHCLNFDYYQY